MSYILNKRYNLSPSALESVLLETWSESSQNYLMPGVPVILAAGGIGNRINEL